MHSPTNWFIWTLKGCLKRVVSRPSQIYEKIQTTSTWHRHTYTIHLHNITHINPHSQPAAHTQCLSNKCFETIVAVWDRFPSVSGLFVPADPIEYRVHSSALNFLFHLHVRKGFRMESFWMKTSPGLSFIMKKNCFAQAHFKSVATVHSISKVTWGSLIFFLCLFTLSKVI